MPDPVDVTRDAATLLDLGLESDYIIDRLGGSAWVVLTHTWRHASSPFGPHLGAACPATRSPHLVRRFSEST